MNRMKLLHKILKNEFARRYEYEIQRMAEQDRMMQELGNELANRYFKTLNAIKTIRERRKI